MRVGILGSGLMGGKLGTIFARAGHRVVFSYARDTAKLERLVRQAGDTAQAGTPVEATRRADAILLAVHWTRIDDVLSQAGDLSDKTLITCSLPMSEDDSYMVVGHTISGAEVLANKVPEAHVVSAFSTAPSEVVFAVYEARGKGPPPDLLYCGDNEPAKNTVALLIREVGFNPIDAGSLSNSRFIEPYSLLVAQLAYNEPEGPALAYRFAHFVEREV